MLLPGFFGADISAGSERFWHNNLSILKFFPEINQKSLKMPGSLNIRGVKVQYPLGSVFDERENPRKGLRFPGASQRIERRMEWQHSIGSFHLTSAECGMSRSLFKK
jgi:hypothetical protein